MYIKLKFFNLWKELVMRLFQHEREPYPIGKTNIVLTKSYLLKRIDLQVVLEEINIDDIKDITDKISAATDAAISNITKGEYIVDLIEEALIAIGFQPDYFAFEDKGQITSMRIMYVDPANGEWRQIHVRVFSDSSVTIHDEITYEEDVRRHLKGDTLHLPAIDIIEKVKIALKITE